MDKVWDAIVWLWMGFLNGLGYAFNNTSVDSSMPIYQMLAGIAVFMIIFFCIALLLTIIYRRYLS